MKYGINDKPPLTPFLLYGLQWWVVALPSLVIMGVVTARLHSAEAAVQIWYMQKLFAIVGLATTIQVLAGHRLPLVIGPASTLLVGLIVSLGTGMDAAYTAIFFGGAVMSVAGFSGIFVKLRFFFTPRIVAVVLILIAFTLSPTILRLIVGDGSGAFPLCFALLMVLALVVINYKLRGAAKSLTVLIGMAGGALVYCLFKGFPEGGYAFAKAADLPWGMRFVFEPGTLLAFVFCFLALVINDLGSIEAVGHMLEAETMDKRIRRGMGVTGIANMASGWFGVIGPVDYSMSAGVIAATGCASRFTLVPAGIGLAVCGFFPELVMLLVAIPGPVMGALLLYLMATQLSNGLAMLVKKNSITDFTSGVIVGLPLMIGLIIAFAPVAVFNAFPEMLRPVVSNGFVMGTLAVILFEHGVFKNACCAPKGLL